MLIAMAVHDTVENKRSSMTKRTLDSLLHTVNWKIHHRLIISDNGSCKDTLDLYNDYAHRFPLNAFRAFLNEENLGTAAAINIAWRHRRAGEHAVKMDNDVVIYQAGWIDWMEDVFDRDPEIGICGLKRKDLEESPHVGGHYHSEIRMLPHEKGQRWLIVEEVEGVIGTCQAYSSALLERIGYLTQPGVYGFDDSLASVRAKVAGFKRVFLHGFEIDHIDPGGDAYCQWKRDQANKFWGAFNSTKILLESGLQDVFFDGGFGDETGRDLSDLS